MNEILFYYEVTWYLEPKEELQYGGFIYADTFTDAAHKLEESFGNELISIDKLYAFDVDVLNIPVKFCRPWFNILQKWENGHFDNEGNDWEEPDDSRDE